MRYLAFAFSLVGSIASAQAPPFWEGVVSDAVEAGMSIDGYLTGEALYRETNKIFVLGYITAVLDTGALVPKSKRYCTPRGVTNGQALDVVMKYLESRPEDRHLGAAFLVRQALRRVWPCPAEPAPPEPTRPIKPQL